MTFEQARAKYVLPSHWGGTAEWPEGYGDDNANQRYLGAVGAIGVFEVYANGATCVDLWLADGQRRHSRLTVREAYALAALLTGGT